MASRVVFAKQFKLCQGLSRDNLEDLPIIICCAKEGIHMVVYTAAVIENSRGCTPVLSVSYAICRAFAGSDRMYVG